MIKLIEPENNTFGALMADLTHKCNMECANCYIPNREVPDMDVEKLYSLVEKLPTRTFIRLIGAEATMREDLFDIIKNIKNMGHRVSLTTNGLKLGREEYVKKLKDAGLRLVLLSMNGCIDDEVYKKLDNGKYAKIKHRALVNLLNYRFIVNTGTIIAKNVNEHIIKEQVNLINNYSIQYSLKVPPVVRLRTIATLGRSMSDHTYEFEEFIEVVCEQLKISKSYISTHLSNAHKNNTSGVVFDYKNVKVRLVDWNVNDEGIPDFGNEVRGRITEDFKIAPFFDHVKENEYGY